MDAHDVCVCVLQDKEHFEICKDTDKEDELRSMQAAWETQQPGRVKKVS